LHWLWNWCHVQWPSKEGFKQIDNRQLPIEFVFFFFPILAPWNFIHVHHILIQSLIRYFFVYY
jgi:hypothetical protein